MTFCTIVKDPEAASVLWSYGAVMAKARHWSFKQIHVLGREAKVVKSEAIVKFGITARQFNGVRFELDQAVNAWKCGLEYRIQSLRGSIDKTQDKVEVLSKKRQDSEALIKSGLVKPDRYNKILLSLKSKLPGKNRRLDILKGRLQKAEAELKSGRPRICFGGRGLLREGGVCDWKARRESRIFIVGSKDETAGNQSCQWDGNKLKLRLADGLGQKFIEIQNAKFRYGQDRLLKALEAKKAITWLLFVSNADGLWHAHATIDEPPADVVTDIRAGVVAVDVNVGHLAVTVVDRYGNPTSKLTLGFPPAGTPAGEAAVIIGDSARALCLLAKSRGYGIACEDLEFSKKKAALREFGKTHARRLSGWSYAKFFALLNARCKREGIDLAQVNPAFTSINGKTKYATGRAMSAHHAAALVIGRAAMGFGEKFVAMDGSALTSPARMRPRTERKRWRMIRRLPREVSQETVRTAGSESGLNHALGLSEDNASVPVRDPGRRRTDSCQTSARSAVALAGQNSVIAG